MDPTDAKFREELVSLLPRLRRFARALTRHAADADDLVQLAVERALTRIEQRRPGMGLVNWVLGIVRNAWIDELRMRKRRDQMFMPDDEALEAVESPADHNVELWSVQSALERLPDEQRLAVALVLVEGLSYREAADVMEVPIGTLTSRLARGRAALESVLMEAEAPAKVPEARK
jgi:RNA polymerase sigma-70 factor (ECF subfamily)